MSEDKTSNGKGSKRRPSFVSEAQLLENWKRIFYHDSSIRPKRMGQTKSKTKNKSNGKKPEWKAL